MFFEPVTIKPNIQTIKVPKVQQVPQESEKCKKWCCQEGLPLVYEDSFSIFGRFVTDELRFIKNDYERNKAKMKISTILFKACTGKFDDPHDNRVREVEADYPVPQIPHQSNEELASFGRYVADELRNNIRNVTANQVTKSKIASLLCESSVSVKHQKDDEFGIE